MHQQDFQFLVSLAIHQKPCADFAHVRGPLVRSFQRAMYRKNGKLASRGGVRRLGVLRLQGDVVLKLRLIRYVGGRIDTREGPKVVDEVGLVKIATRQGDFRPIDAVLAARYVPQYSLEALHAAVNLRR